MIRFIASLKISSQILHKNVEGFIIQNFKNLKPFELSKYKRKTTKFGQKVRTVLNSWNFEFYTVKNFYCNFTIKFYNKGNGSLLPNAM